MKKWFVTAENKLRFRTIPTVAVITGILWIIERWLEQYSHTIIHVINAFVATIAAFGIYVTATVLVKWTFDWFIAPNLDQYE